MPVGVRTKAYGAATWRIALKYLHDYNHIVQLLSFFLKMGEIWLNNVQAYYAAIFRVDLNIWQLRIYQ